VLTTGGEHLLDHIGRQRRMDRAWLKSLLADIKANGIRDIADPAKLARQAPASQSTRSVQP